MKRPEHHTAAYVAISRDLRNQIFSQKLKPRDPLPSENQLCAEYGVSRETVRKGLKELETEGLILSKPKVGYFVSDPNHNSISITFTEEFNHCVPSYQKVHIQAPDAQVQQVLDIPPNRKVIVYSLVYYNEERQPVALDVKYAPYERAYPSVESELRYAVFPDITTSKITTYAYYVEASISAAGATKDVAASLKCPAGTPLLLVERTYIQQDGRRIAFGRQYLLQPFGRLQGVSGAIQEK